MSDLHDHYQRGRRPSAEAHLHPRRTDHARELRAGFARELLEATAVLPRGGTVVDFGCANRPYEDLLLARFDRYIGADLEGNDLADVTVEASGHLPLPDGSVDCVFSTQVIEHVPDVSRYLSEARRVVRPDGHLLLSTNGHYRYHPDPQDLWRWTPDGLVLELARAWFETYRLRSVLSGPSAALQLWQSTTMGALPGLIRRGYVWFFQGLIRLVERLGSRLDSREFDTDAVAYLLLARPAEPTCRPEFPRTTGESLSGT